MTTAGLPADVNECETQRCSQECANIYGSYQCYCRQGYQLAEDGHTCTGISLCTGPLPERHPFPEHLAPRESLLNKGYRGHSEALASNQNWSPIAVTSGCVTLGRCFLSLTLGPSPAKWRPGPDLSGMKGSVECIQTCVWYLIVPQLVVFVEQPQGASTRMRVLFFAV